MNSSGWGNPLVLDLLNIENEESDYINSREMNNEQSIKSIKIDLVRGSINLCSVFLCSCGRGSVVSIASGYGLDDQGIESRWGARFSVPVQTGPEVHPVSCTMGTGSFPGVKSGQGVTLTPHPLLVPWSRKGRAIPLLPLWAVQPVQSLSAWTRGALYLFYFFICCWQRNIPL